VALELSSFKCGQDAPIYSVVEEIIETSGTPYFAFKDINENKPSGSIRIRIETMAYSLGRYREELARRRRAMDEIEDRLHALERTLHAGSSEPVDPGPADAPTSRVHEDRTAVR
jgi:hypothetical protein